MNINVKNDVTNFSCAVHAEFCAAEIMNFNCLLNVVYRFSTSGDLSIFKDSV